ncbi:bifunctional diguanylate cyclase/phosphodiesterase [Rhizobium sp. RM]|uniref:putative bifunctional diguanylate cyclase/phosphodiesterase n=1 Tax=Rhizobium sp. RM TaxID=2748079 RepID=UPI00110DF432|nr:bifunctional diguanylate cyclase/phosphodiesterase [Rhizobium sp. RM]NWJ23485.1 bifunctional diguanylate cyclase/phosphodiesterase [Rhizobium sp. RM]TMV19305.1 bifunctional diguanylate cyclase/phosphodiesterase [Rhizobium sp. Td3]
MRSPQSTLHSSKRAPPAPEVSTDKLFLFDRYFNLIEPRSVAGAHVLNEGISLGQLHPYLDLSIVMSHARSGDPDPLRLTHDLGNGHFTVLTFYSIGDMLGMVQSYRSPDDDERATLLHQATHDPLTGLPNRRQFSSDLSDALWDIETGDDVVSLMQLDLDDFKPVNDTLGHPAGDKLLQLAASRIKSCITGEDQAYRLAGDEFAVISRGEGHPARSRELGDRLVHAFKEPFTLDGIAVFVGISVGISIAPRDGADPEKLMKASDIALYAAKTEGRGRASTFDAKMLYIIEQRELLRRSLRMALETRQFLIEYQPIVEPSGVVGFEALLRWEHPLLGTIPPSVFIPMAEADGLMPEIGLWVLEHACREALNWPSDFIVAVNVSPAEFLSNGITDRISQTLDEVGLPADRLELEITESVLLERTVNNLDTLNTLSVLGIRIALDDFGTQYSSLSYLKNFPFDTLKIDKYFILDLEANPKSRAIIRSVITLAHDLGMQITAEGVETDAQAKWLRNLGCDRLQGYLISEPLTGDAIKTFLKVPKTQQGLLFL